MDGEWLNIPCCALNFYETFRLLRGCELHANNRKYNFCIKLRLRQTVQGLLDSRFPSQHESRQSHRKWKVR